LQKQEDTRWTPKDDDTTLLAYLEKVPDPRGRRGKQYEWRLLLTILCGALLSGCKSVREMADWAEQHRQELCVSLHTAKARIPSAATLYRALRSIDIEQLERQVAAYGRQVDAQDPSSGRVEGRTGESWRGQALDGKEVRGASAHGAAVLLVSLVRHGSATVLAQQRVAARYKHNEMKAVPQLLSGRDLRATVTTMDALLTQRAIAQQVLDQGGDYLMVVKRNQGHLWWSIRLLFDDPPAPREEDDRLRYRYSEKGHGRLETRTLVSSAALSDYLDWPGVGQVMQRTYRCVQTRTGRVSEEVTYGLTSLSRERAGPQQLEALWRGHWTIENRDHYVRDETLGEDRCQMHSGQGAQALAALRNGVLNLLRHRGWSNIAEALRFYAAAFPKALSLIGATAT
jgi:predicted transposase YbfD/YdcC